MVFEAVGFICRQQIFADGGRAPMLFSAALSNVRVVSSQPVSNIPRRGSPSCRVESVPHKSEAGESFALNLRKGKTFSKKVTSTATVVCRSYKEPNR